MATQEAIEKRLKLVDHYFTTKEIFAMWKAVTRVGAEKLLTQRLITQRLMGKLYDLLTDEERNNLRSKFDTEYKD